MTQDAAKNALMDYAYYIGNKIKDKIVASKIHANGKKKLRDAVDEALKWLDLNSLAKVEEYKEKMKELEHKVQLLESKEKILVYEYVPKGSLDLYLEKDELNWATRLRICIGAARGLVYLHSSVGTQQRVLHRDVKSSNILLDDNWKARIWDLGLSKFGPANQQFTFLVSHDVGTIGYCDPLYVETGLLTKESDVYSFGVVLFEVLCGRLCIGNGNNKHLPLTRLVRQFYEQNKIDELVFNKIKDEINPKSLNVFTAIAYQCLNRDRETRPLMTEIVRELEKALEYQVVLYVDMEVYVDSGAQSTIISKTCAERSRLLRLVDERYKGIAHIGQSEIQILGRIHVAPVKIGNYFYPCSFVVLDSPNMEVIFGSDMLRHLQCTIDLKENVLRVGVGEVVVPFLQAEFEAKAGKLIGQGFTREAVVQALKLHCSIGF
ncbi:protein kinase, ATP binding site-containing protein [Tanacetum coccineum]